jgi:hypothetical protein
VRIDTRRTRSGDPGSASRAHAPPAAAPPGGTAIEADAVPVEASVRPYRDDDPALAAQAGEGDAHTFSSAFMS